MRAMKAETQLIKAAINAKHELNAWLNCCTQQEIRESFMGMKNAADRIDRAVQRIKEESDEG